MRPIPPVDLCATQFLRCFMEIPTKSAGTQEKLKLQSEHTAMTLAPEVATIKEIGRPYEGFCVVFDTETTTDPRQALRVGVYAVYGLDSDERIARCRRGQLTRDDLDLVVERGIFYAPNELTTADVRTLKRHAKQKKLKCFTRDAFIQQVFYPWVYWKQALCIGHNLPFDLSRLATVWGRGIKRYRDGF